MTHRLSKYFGKVTKACAAFVIALTIVFAPATYIQEPPPVHASGLLTFDAANFVKNTITAVNSINSNTITTVLNGIAWSVAKAAIASIQRSTVNWINSGFKGSPAFATDLSTNLQNVSDAVANSFFAQLNNTVVGATGFNIKSPFQDQLSAQLRTVYYQQASNYGLNPFTLGQTSGSPTAFLNGNFSQGGFNAYLSASQNPQNNPFGAYLAAQNALFATINQATTQRKTELDWGKGFLSYRANCPATIGSINQSIANQSSTLTASALPSASSGGILGGSAYQAPGTSRYTGSTGSTGNILTNSAPTDTSLSVSSPTVNLSSADTCVGQKISTPGAEIQSQLDKALGANVDTLVSADQINEVLGALANQLVLQVIGPNGLLSASSPSAGGGASAVSGLTAQDQNNAQVSSLADGFKQSLSTQRQQIVIYQSNEQSILNVANVANNTCGSTASQYPEIQTAITNATAGVSKATTSLNAIDSLIANITTAQSAPAASQATAITAVITQNQNFLSSSALPTAQDIAQATADSTDTGTTTPPSLYSKLQQDSKTCSSIRPTTI